MGGRPVWLASLARRDDRGEIIPTEKWSPSQRRAARKVLYEHALAGVGDEKMERGFRMCATLCIHRSLTDAEIAAMPAERNVKPLDLAGGPLEVLWRTEGVRDSLSTHPCHKPGKEPLTGKLWFPKDCGACAPCVARAALLVARAKILEAPILPAGVAI